MRNFKFYSALALLIITNIALIGATSHLLNSFPSTKIILLIEFAGWFGAYTILGIGISIPLVLLASLLGWVHLALLVSGKIDPHLSQDGFFKVITTLFNKL